MARRTSPPFRADGLVTTKTPVLESTDDLKRRVEQAAHLTATMVHCCRSNDSNGPSLSLAAGAWPRVPGRGGQWSWMSRPRTLRPSSMSR